MESKTRDPLALGCFEQLAVIIPTESSDRLLTELSSCQLNNFNRNHIQVGITSELLNALSSLGANEIGNIFQLGFSFRRPFQGVRQIRAAHDGETGTLIMN